MIARLHGRVVDLEADAVVLDVGGVGYRVHVPGPMLSDLGPEGTSVTLHTHLVVRENEWLLVGLGDKASLALFAMLLSVSGVGPRAALALLSVMDTPSLQRAIVEEDIALLTRAPGVGRKTAQRIVLELKGRLETQVDGLVGIGTPSAEQAEAVEALVALGYTVGEARRALAATKVDEGADVETRVLAALRTLSR